MQEWVDAFKLNKLTPMLDEMGAEGDEDVATIMELEAEDLQELRAALPRVKQRKFDKGLTALQQHKRPKVEQTYLLPETVTISDQTESVLGQRTRTVRIHSDMAIDGDTADGDTEGTAQVTSSRVLSRRVLPSETSSVLQTTRFVTEPGTAPEHAIGDIITVWRFGKDVVECKIINELGRGAQAIVFLVQSQGRECALKVASVLPVADEARALLRVNSPRKHPHVLEAQYVCSPVGGDNELLFLQELIRGASLAELIENGQVRRADGEGNAELQLQQRLGTMFVQLMAALAHVHACGVLHQDVKPDNIMVDTATWHVYLIDFGIATIAKEGLFDGRGAIRAQMRGGTAPT